MSTLNIPDHLPLMSTGRGDCVSTLCAMQYVAVISGAPWHPSGVITDHPPCSSFALTRMVHSLNARYGKAEGILGPQEALELLDIGMSTVGTSGHDDDPTVWSWLAELTTHPALPDHREQSRIRRLLGWGRGPRPASWAPLRALMRKRATGQDVSEAQWLRAAEKSGTAMARPVANDAMDLDTERIAARLVDAIPNTTAAAGFVRDAIALWKTAFVGSPR